MGMYCCCGQKITIDFENCRCDWTNWISIYDWPKERKNKEKSFSLPDKNGKYYVRYQNNSGDRDECIQDFSLITRTEKCGYTGKEFDVHWSGNDESQPYAWRELKKDEIEF